MCEQAAEWTKVEAYPYVSALSLTSELHLLLQFLSLHYSPHIKQCDHFQFVNLADHNHIAAILHVCSQLGPISAVQCQQLQQQNQNYRQASRFYICALHPRSFIGFLLIRLANILMVYHYHNVIQAEDQDMLPCTHKSYTKFKSSYVGKVSFTGKFVISQTATFRLTLMIVPSSLLYSALLRDPS